MAGSTGSYGFWMKGLGYAPGLIDPILELLKDTYWDPLHTSDSRA